jgi:flagellar hook assembly protein FlgD
LCKNEKISVKIYDVLGRRVKTLIDSEKNEGLHSVQWDGRNSVGVDVAAGIYFARLESGTQTRITKLLLVR